MTNKVIIALDYEKEADALALVDQLDPQICRLKVGKEMFTTLGTGFVKQLHSRHFDVFLDLNDRMRTRLTSSHVYNDLMPDTG